MEIKHQKNSHILIDSDSGYLKVDSESNIRRTSIFGRLWFMLSDWWTGGEKTKQLNAAIQITLLAIQDKLGEVKEGLENLSDELNKLPCDKRILSYALNSDAESNKEIIGLNNEVIETLVKVKLLVFKLNLMTDGYIYSIRVNNLRDISQAILKHSQVSEETKNHVAVQLIDDFFTLKFIESEIAREYIEVLISRKY